MMDKLRIGVIGCGYWGPNLIRNFIEQKDTQLVGVSDLQLSRLEHIQGRYPQIEVATQDYCELLDKDLDGVVVATPPPFHFQIVQEALMKGLNVLVEKPITLNSQDALDLIHLAEAKDRVLMVGHTFLYNPAVRALKAYIDNGELGDVQYIDAVRASLGLFQNGLNVIWDLAPHDLSILMYLLGTEPLEISAQGEDCIQAGVEDVAYITLRFPGNVLAHIHASWLDPLKTRRITVVGSKKMVLYDDIESQEKLRIYDKGVQAIRRTDTYGEWQFSYHYGDIVTPYIRMEEPLRVECGHFIECIREHRQPLTDGWNGLSVVRVIEAAQRSLAKGGTFEQLDAIDKSGVSTEAPDSTIEASI